MKLLPLFFTLLLFVGCDVDSEEVITEQSIDEEEVLIGSFRIGNTEIREEIIEKLAAQGIQHWLNDDNSISYLLADGKIIDTIGNEVISSYITRN